MNAAISPASETALRKHVERAVRPVLATEHRKMRMREELLAHLTEIFVEEQQRLGDETAALAKSRARFGDPAELTAELNRSASRWQRAATAIEYLVYLSIRLFKGKNTSWTRYAICSFLGSASFIIVGLLVVLGVKWLIDGEPDSEGLFAFPRITGPWMIVELWYQLMSTSWLYASPATGARRWMLLLCQSGAWSLLFTAVVTGCWWLLDGLLSPSEIALLGVKTFVAATGVFAINAIGVDIDLRFRRQQEVWTSLEIDN